MAVESAPAPRARRAHLRAAPPASTVQRTDLGGGSLRSEALNLVMSSTVKPFIAGWSYASWLPWPYHVVDQVGRLMPAVRGTRFTSVQLPYCRATEVLPPTGAEATDRVIVYLHGGAFLVGGDHLHRQLISRIAAATGARVLAPNYRKLPRFDVCDAVQDGLDAYRRVLADGARPDQVTFMGDSAGGFLTFMVTLAAQKAGLPVPAAIVAMSPLIDLEHATGRGCTLFPDRALKVFRALAARTHGRTHGRDIVFASPSTSLLADLPPVLIQVSSAESLYPEAVRMADLVAGAGGHCELEVWDRQIHVFQASAGILPEAAEAVARVCDFVARMVPSAASGADLDAVAG